MVFFEHSLLNNTSIIKTHICFKNTEDIVFPIEQVDKYTIIIINYGSQRRDEKESTTTSDDGST